MKKKADVSAIKEFEAMREEMTLQDAIIESNRCLLCEDAPCSKGCPAGTDPGKFIRQIKFQNYKGAARTIRNNNILGSSCAHICPTEQLCELGCTASELTHPINIGGLQQFAISFGKYNNLEPLVATNKTAGKVAVIGAGPAGLACAAELAKMNYDVTVYERDSEGGGVLRWNIPDFRLPLKVIEDDLKNVLDLGIEIKYNESIDTKEKADKLLNDFDAIFLGTGLSKPFSLPVLDGFENSKSYIDFLRLIKISKEKAEELVKDKFISVIGGGSAAIDCAASAVALGAKRVYVIHRRDEFRALPEEIELGHELNIVFKPSIKITSVKSKDNKIIAIKGNEVDYKIGNIVDIEDTEFSLRSDVVIQSIGTYSVINELFPDLETYSKGCVVSKDSVTNQSKVFAGGDLINGGTTAVQAIGEGKKAAMAIDNFIKGGK